MARQDSRGEDLPRTVLDDLEADVAETTNVADEHPDTVRRLLQLAEKARDDLGDVGRPGSNQRPSGWVGDPKPQVLAPRAENVAGPSAIRQSARAIPVVKDVDVLVIGGSTADARQADVGSSET
jgi:hypothetical protein